MVPKKFGDWMSTQAVSDVIDFSSSLRLIRRRIGKGHRCKRHALVMGIGREHLAIFRMHAASDEDGIASGDADGHHGGFGGSGRPVIHRGVRDFHAGQFGNHRLKFEDRLQRSLREFGLIRRVGSEEFATRYERIDDDRAVVHIRACAKKASVSVAIFFRALLEPVDNFRFRHLTWNVEIAGQAVFGGDGSEKIVDRAYADGFQHGGPVGGRLGKISHKNRIWMWLMVSWLRTAVCRVNEVIRKAFKPRRSRRSTRENGDALLRFAS